jgi:hypothetical protein
VSLLLVMQVHYSQFSFINCQCALNIWFHSFVICYLPLATFWMFTNYLCCGLGYLFYKSAYLMCVFVTCHASSSLTTPALYLLMCLEYLEFKSFLTYYLPLILFMLFNYLCCSFCYFIYKFKYLMGVFLLVM